MRLPFSKGVFFVCLLLCVLFSAIIFKQDSQAFWTVDASPPIIHVICNTPYLEETQQGGLTVFNKTDVQRDYLIQSTSSGPQIVNVFLDLRTIGLPPQPIPGLNSISCSPNEDNKLIIEFACEDNVSGCIGLHYDADTVNLNNVRSNYYEKYFTIYPPTSPNEIYNPYTASRNPAFDDRIELENASNFKQLIISLDAKDEAENQTAIAPQNPLSTETITYLIAGHIMVSPNNACRSDPALKNYGGLDFTLTKFFSVSGSSNNVGGDPERLGGGAYQVANVPAGASGQIALTGVPTGYGVSTCNNPPFQDYTNLNNTYVNQDFYITPLSTLEGFVILDYDHNAANDTGYDKGLSGATVELSGCSQTRPPYTTGSDGKYSFPNLPPCPGGYSITVTNVGTGYTMNYTANAGNPNPRTIPITTGGTTVQVSNFYATPLYRISGNIFVDDDYNQVKNGSEKNYSGSTQPIQIRPTSNNTGGTSKDAPTSNGSYSDLVISGEYSVALPAPLPSGYLLSYPKNNPAQFTVGVGNSAGPTNFRCSPQSHNNATCTSTLETGTALTGSIINVNFGLSNSMPWTQCVGADCRKDTGYKSFVPPDAASCPTSPYASTPLSTNPGVIFSGNSDFSFCPDGVGACQDKASSTQWVVKGTASDPELFVPRYPKNLTVSFASLYSKIITKGGVAPIPLENVCNPASCTLTNVPKGVYTTTSNVNINASTIGANRGIIILVGNNGNLSQYKTVTIQGDIKVPTTSTLTVSVRGDIVVNGSIGVAPNSTATSIEGFYSADRDVIVNSASATVCDSTNPDKRINFGGTIIANAAFTGGSFQNKRNLCGENQCPTATFVERPDFFLNAPDTLKNKSLYWKEQAP